MYPRKSKQSHVARSPTSTLLPKTQCGAGSLGSDWLGSNPDSTTRYPVWLGHIIWPIHALISTTIRQWHQGHWGPKMILWEAWLTHGKHSDGEAALQREVGGQSWGMSVAPKYFGLHWTNHRVPLKALGRETANPAWHHASYPDANHV